MNTILPTLIWLAVIVISVFSYEAYGLMAGPFIVVIGIFAAVISINL